MNRAKIPTQTIESFLSNADGPPAGRLVIVWHAGRDGKTEYRVLPEGLADEDPRWCVAELRRIAAHIERLGGWMPVDIGTPASGRGPVLELDDSQVRRK